MEGVSLEDRLSEENNLTEDKVKIIIRQVAQAISYTHEFNVTHRDVCPSNIFFTSRNSNDFNVLLSGYRYAAGFGITQNMFNPNRVWCQAPEVHNAIKVDSAVDIWALGITAYFCLEGIAPFGGRTNDDRKNAIATKEVVFHTPELSSEA